MPNIDEKQFEHLQINEIHSIIHKLENKIYHMLTCNEFLWLLSIFKYQCESILFFYIIIIGSIYNLYNEQNIEPTKKYKKAMQQKCLSILFILKRPQKKQ